MDFSIGFNKNKLSGFGMILLLHRITYGVMQVYHNGTSYIRGMQKNFTGSILTTDQCFGLIKMDKQPMNTRMHGILNMVVLCLNTGEDLLLTQYKAFSLR